MRTAGVGLVLALAVATGGCSRIAEGQYRAAEQARVKDAISAYEEARNHGDRVAVCVRAGVVASAYADAHDLPNQQAWSARRKEDCQAAYSALTPGAQAGALDAAR